MIWRYPISLFIFLIVVLFSFGRPAHACTTDPTNFEDIPCASTPTQTTPQPQTTPCPECSLAIPSPGISVEQVPIPSVCHEMFPVELKGAQTMPPKFKYLNAEVCQAYQDLLARFQQEVGGCTASSGVDKLHAVTGLNGDFAIGLYKTFKEMPGGGPTITSAYREATCNGGAANSNHKLGCAIDVASIARPAGSYCDASCQNIRNLGPKNGIHIPAMADCHYGANFPNECNHIEPVNLKACTNEQKANVPVAGLPGSTGPISYVSNPTLQNGRYIVCSTSPFPILAVSASDCRRVNANTTLSSLNCTYVAVGGQNACLMRHENCTSGGLLSSLFGGGNNCSSGSGGFDFSKMMQLMGGMQLGQSLGGSLFGGGSGSSGTSAQTPTYYNPLIPPPTPMPNPITSTPRPPGTSAIDDLIASLGREPATTSGSSNVGTNVSVSTTSVGELEPTTSSGSSLVTVSTVSTTTLVGEIAVLTDRLSAASSAIAVASSTGSTSAITGALNSIGGALTAIGQFLANIFTPNTTPTP